MVFLLHTQTFSHILMQKRVKPQKMRKWKRNLLKELTKSGKKIEKVNILNFPPIFPARSALLKSKQTRKKFQLFITNYPSKKKFRF